MYGSNEIHRTRQSDNRWQENLLEKLDAGSWCKIQGLYNFKPPRRREFWCSFSVFLWTFLWIVCEFFVFFFVNFLQILCVFFANFLWTFYEFVKFSWIFCQLFVSVSWIFCGLFVNFLWISCDFFVNFLSILCKFLSIQRKIHEKMTKNSQTID